MTKQQKTDTKSMKSFEFNQSSKTRPDAKVADRIGYKSNTKKKRKN